MVSVREKGEGHAKQSGRRQNRRGNHQRKVWYEESGGCAKLKTVTELDKTEQLRVIHL